MSIFTIIEGLRTYNLWRRGDEKIEQPDPKEIGKLIDEAVAILERDAASTEKNNGISRVS